METFPYTIEYYLTEKGEKPFRNWLDGLRDIAARNTVRIRLDRVRMGNFGDNRPIGNSVYELKIDHGPGYRVYFALDGKAIVLLLIGGDKSSQGKDIAKAQEYWLDHTRRKKDEKKDKHVSGRPH